jgi:hypothetical protein
MLDVTDRDVVVRQFGQGPRACGQVPVWKFISWPGARTSADRQRTEAIRIILEPATFQQVAGRNPAYAVPTGLHCPEKYVAFPSSCRPARTWIDRESKGLTTDTTLSIPYCRGQDRAYRILLRLGDGSIAIGKLWSRLAR